MISLPNVPNVCHRIKPEAIRNAKVASSIPASGTSNIKDLARLIRFGFFLSGFRVGAVQVLLRFSVRLWEGSGRHPLLLMGAEVLFLDSSVGRAPDC